ncbi:YARHG domain-containing protein [Paenibacillus sp. sgz500958]|uniref:YARHG domain-containing protein n=1 Tax=Paenibacillus sp. sgz500958 TaxID=3242475 RepID=UPI0036D43106
MIKKSLMNLCFAFLSATVLVSCSGKENTVPKQVSGNDLHTIAPNNTSEYIIQDSDKVQLTSIKVSNLDGRSLEIARNEIYARHGYIFKRKDLSDFFHQKSWYKENPEYKGELNAIEKKNVELIQSYEAKNAANPLVTSRPLDPGSIHKDMITLYGEEYDVYFWNDGDFDYTRFEIMQDNNVIFDSKEEGLDFEGGDKIWDTNFWVKGIEQNGRPTFLFELADNRPNPAVIVLEEIDNDIQVTVSDNIQAEFEDVDHDGKEELLGFPSYGQLPLAPALVTAYEWNGSQYEPSIELTTQYWEDQILQSEKEYKDNPSE